MTNPKFYYNKTEEFRTSASDLPPPYTPEHEGSDEQQEQQVGLLRLDDKDGDEPKSKIVRVFKRWYKVLLGLVLVWLIVMLFKSFNKPEVVVISEESADTSGIEKQKAMAVTPEKPMTTTTKTTKSLTKQKTVSSTDLTIPTTDLLPNQDNVTSTTTITEVIETNGVTEQNVTTTITEVLDTNGMTNVVTETTVAETTVASDPILCKGEPASLWDELPHQISFLRNIKLVIKGKVSGQVTVKPLNDQQGLITSDVHFAPSELLKEMTYELTQGELTTLVLDFPQEDDEDDEDEVDIERGCMNVNVTIGLPLYASRLFLDVENVDIKLFPLHVTFVNIRNTNGNIVLGNWAGDELSVINSNGYVHANQISAKENVHIENANGPIQIGKRVEADHELNLLNQNGAIETIETLYAEDNIRIETSNGVIRSNDLRADTIKVSSTNEAIYLNHLEADAIGIRGSNAPIMASISEAKDSEVRIASTNGRVNLNVTKSFEGFFSLRTTQGNVTVNDNVTYKVNTTNIKTGYRKKGKGLLSVITTNSDVDLLFK